MLFHIPKIQNKLSKLGCNEDTIQTYLSLIPPFSHKKCLRFLKTLRRNDPNQVTKILGHAQEMLKNAPPLDPIQEETAEELYTELALEREEMENTAFLRPLLRTAVPCDLKAFVTEKKPLSLRQDSWKLTAFKATSTVAIIWLLFQTFE